MDEKRLLPHEVTEYLQKWILELRSPAFFFTDPAGRVISRGGDLSRYGLRKLRKGDLASEKAYFLEGLLPLDSRNSMLSRVETCGGAFADVHLFPATDADCTLLLDATEEVAERAGVEQVLRQTEEHLRQAEKMESLGRLAGGIAHDFNNLLTVILGYGNLLANSLPDERTRSQAQEIVQVANRAAAMTQQLLSFGRRQARKIEVLDLNAIIAGLEGAFRRLIEEDIVLTVNLQPCLPFIEADRGQMEQVLVNLVVNARDAMPNGGALEIRTANVEVDEAYTINHVGTPLHHGPHASLSVSDSGCGMDAETKARAFEPFFTSKRSNQGTGLGLSIVYGIVAQSGGEIILTSELEKGTRFEILLPAVERVPSAAGAETDRSPARGSETVLVVEDEAAVRKMISQVLTQLGYTVLEATDALNALEMCEQYPAKINLLVTDLIMPQMNGRELAARIAVNHPETHVLYVSGYTKESFDVRGIAMREGVFLMKPFTPGRLAERVREALCQPATVSLGDPARR